MKDRARRHNVTGIKHLSIGTTSNDRGYVLRRYTVNATPENGVPVARSFYFGARCPQETAFLAACNFMKELGLMKKQSKAALLDLYQEYQHETLLD